MTGETMELEKERKAKALELLRLAAALLESDLSALVEGERRDTYGSALWKAVDAAGLLMPLCFYDAQGQPGRPTGRGFMMATGERWLRHMHKPGEL